MRDPVRLFGTLPASVVAATPAFPRGEADGVLLQPFQDFDTCFDLAPGESVLVRGVVLARNADTATDSPLTAENRSWSSMLPIKMRVKSKGLPNEYLIDSDRQIVLPGNVCGELLAPSTWTAERPDDREGMIEASVFVSACPVRCCYPPLPHLTYWRNYPDVGAADALRTFIVPRGARSLAMYKSTFSLPGTTTIEWWIGSAGTGRMIRSEAVASSVNSVTFPVGAANEVRFTPANNAAGVLGLQWEIEA
jgi:hypothetical protein